MTHKILITGGAGFIGSNLVRALSEKGYKNIVVLDSLSPQIHGSDPEQTSPLYKSIKDKVSFVQGCVTKEEDWKKVLKDDVSAIIHLAAETGTGQSMYEIKRYADVNIGGTALMLDLLANDKTLSVRKVIVASSRSIYGEGKYRDTETQQDVYPGHRSSEDMDKGDFEVKYKGAYTTLELQATDEDSKIHPSSVYGITKQNQEQMVMTVCPTINIDAVAFRYQNVYGPGQSLSNPYTGILSIFSTLIKNGKAINIFEDGKESRDFVYIDDVVRATIAGLEREEARNEVFNVGSGVATDVMTVATTLINNYKADVPVHISGNYRLGDIRHNYADLTKIRSVLGFEPSVDFAAGISRFTDWVNLQERVDSKYDDSIAEMKERGFYK